MNIKERIKEVNQTLDLAIKSLDIDRIFDILVLRQEYIDKKSFKKAEDTMEYILLTDPKKFDVNQFKFVLEDSRIDFKRFEKIAITIKHPSLISILAKDERANISALENALISAKFEYANSYLPILIEFARDIPKANLEKIEDRIVELCKLDKANYQHAINFISKVKKVNKEKFKFLYPNKTFFEEKKNLKIIIVDPKNQKVIDQCRDIARENVDADPSLEIGLNYTRNDSNYVLAVMDNFLVVGFIFLKELSNDSLYFSEMAVRKDYARNGVGTKMVDYILDHCKGFKYLYSNVLKSNYKSNGFHLKLGFNQYEEEKYFGKYYSYSKEIETKKQNHLLTFTPQEELDEIFLEDISYEENNLLSL